MGSLMSKQSSGNTATTRSRTSEENSFTNSLRYSLRIKRHSTNPSDVSRPQSELSPSDLSKAPTLVRPGLPESFQQTAGYTATPTPSLATPKTVNVPSTSNVAPTPVPEPSKVNVPKNEIDNAMDMLKGAIEAKGKEVEGIVNQKLEEINEKIEEKKTGGSQQMSAFHEAVVAKGNKAEEVVDKKLEEIGEKVHQKVDVELPKVEALKGAIEAKGKEVKEVVDKKLNEFGENVQESADEGRLQVENILSRLAPADKSGDQSPEVETAPKPAAASLLAALEKRKEKVNEVEKRDLSPPSGVSNVLESIAAGSAAVRSQEAASLMSAFAVSASEKTQTTSKVAETGSKVNVPKEEVNQAMNILKGAIEAKGKEVKEVVDKKLNEFGENVQESADEGRLQVENILSRLAPADKSGDQSPEVETAPKPAAASLLAALEKRKEKVNEVEKRDLSPPSGVSNVLESIAAGSAAVRSQEAASLMSAFTSPPEKTEAGKKFEN